VLVRAIIIIITGGTDDFAGGGEGAGVRAVTGVGAGSPLYLITHRHRFPLLAAEFEG
jgi:hypothetical protein